MARTNKRGLELSFKKSGNGTRGRWYSRVGGKVVYFGWGNGVTDRASYGEALAAFGQHKSEQVEEAKVKERGPVPSSFGACSWTDLEKGLQAWSKRLDEAKAEATSATATIKTKTLIDDWLADIKKRNDRRHWVEQQRAEGKVIQEGPRENVSDGRYAAYLLYGDFIKSTVGEEVWDGTEANCARLLKTYRDACERLLHEGKNKPNTFNERMKCVRTFITWCDENYKLDRVPRAIKKLCSKFAYQPSAKAVPVEVIKIIWGEADDRMKAYIALALNAGYYAIDISVLEAANIKDGRIIRERNKTGVPTNYKLWKVTQELIAKAGSPSGRTFVGIGGKQLVYYVGRDRIDAIADRWDILRRKLVASGKMTAEQARYSFSNLRDTSTTFVEDNDPSLSDQFDGHKDTRQARFYIDQSHLQSRQQKLDAIVDIGEQDARLSQQRC